MAGRSDVTRYLTGDPRLALSVIAPGDPLSTATVRGEVVERLEGERAVVVVDRTSPFVARPTPWWADDCSEG